MVDAVRLVVGQARGLAGDVRVIVRTLDDGGGHARPIRALRRQRRPRGCRSPCPGRDRDVRAGLQRARAAGAASGRPAAGLAAQRGRQSAGALAPGADTADQGTAAAQLAEALGATRVADRQPEAGRRHRVRDRSRLGRGRRRHRSGRRSGCLCDADPRAHGRAAGGGSRSSPWPVRPAPGRTSCCVRSRLLPKAQRPSVVAPQAFGTLAFLDDAGAAADGVRVLSRFVPPSSSAATRATSRAPTPTSTGSRPRGALRGRRRARRPRGGGGHDRLARGGGHGAARPAAHEACWDAGQRPRRAASRRGGWRCSWPAGRSAPNG